jgi:hypothetical protein
MKSWVNMTKKLYDIKKDTKFTICSEFKCTIKEYSELVFNMYVQ